MQFLHPVLPLNTLFKALFPAPKCPKPWSPEMTVYVAENVVRKFNQKYFVLKTTPVLTEFSRRGCTIHKGHRSKMSVLSSVSDNGPLRSNTAYLMILLYLSIPYSEDSCGIRKDGATILHCYKPQLQ